MGKGSGGETTLSLQMASQVDYLQGLKNLRRLVSGIENDVGKLKQDFYNCEENDEEKYENYLKGCNERLLYCNNQLKKNQLELSAVDSELKLMSMLNNVRELEDMDPEVISILTEFWEKLKDAIESVRLMKGKFQSTCLKRLESSCVSYQDKDVRLELTGIYSKTVLEYQTEIVETLGNVDQLIQSYNHGIRQDLFTSTSFSNRILVTCDQKAFPILSLVPDLIEKMEKVLSLSKQWIDNDETYIRDINNFIQESRKLKREKDADLGSQIEKQNQLVESVDDAFQVFKENKSKLVKIESELHTLEQTSHRFIESKKYKLDEVRQKEGMVSFLDISISQTKKNYTLQLKRSRLQRQLKELGEMLNDIEKELCDMEEELKEKTTERLKLSEQVNEKNSSYKTFKSDLDSLNTIVDNLQKEVETLTESLSQLEMIQNIKTCPENVEDFYERPSTVKLAPSLKEKILIRRQKLMNPRTEQDISI